jgi:pimeloyl-ACP methyl ester carboxylesterase
VSKLRATRVVHCSIEIARPASVVWKWIRNDIAEAQHYLRLGYRIDPLDDPAACVKAYRLRLESPGMNDEIRAEITELDEKVMRLSMFAEFSSPQAKGLVAYVTYQSAASGTGSLLKMDCHAAFDLDVDEHASADHIARNAEAGRQYYERDTSEWFAEVKSRLEKQIVNGRKSVEREGGLMAEKVIDPIATHDPNWHKDADAATYALPKEYDWRKTIAENQALPRDGIEHLEGVRLGGIEQWISVRGTSPDNPLLLWLHGGPGYPMMGESWAFQRPWEDFFTMVQWDQRGGGKTLRANGGRLDAPLTVDRMQMDAEELIGYLLKKYRKDKLFLLGHSWGTVPGVRIAVDHPHLLHAYIGVGQIANMREGEAVGYQTVLEKARRDGNAEAVRQLEALAPYPGTGLLSLEAITQQRLWVQHYGGMISSVNLDNEVDRWRMSPLYDDQDVLVTIAGAFPAFNSIFRELMDVDFNSVDEVLCPFFILQGSEDLATPALLSRRLFDRLKAPHKKYFDVKGTAHYPFLEAPGRALVDMVQHVLPMANERR